MRATKAGFNQRLTLENNLLFFESVFCQDPFSFYSLLGGFMNGYDGIVDHEGS
mgnify:CR=1 FL=1